MKQPFGQLEQIDILRKLHLALVEIEQAGGMRVIGIAERVAHVLVPLFAVLFDAAFACCRAFDGARVAQILGRDGSVEVECIDDPSWAPAASVQADGDFGAGQGIEEVAMRAVSVVLMRWKVWYVHYDLLVSQWD
jgi:hypothetical protein